MIESELRWCLHRIGKLSLVEVVVLDDLSFDDEMT